MFDGRGCGSISGCAESRAGGTEPTPGGCRGARSPSGHCWHWVLVGRSGTCPCCPPQRVPSPAQPAGQQTGAEGCLGCSAPPQSRPGAGDWIGAGPQRSWGSSRSALGSPGPGGTAGSTAGIGPGNGSVLTGCARYCYHYSYQYRYHYCVDCRHQYRYHYCYHKAGREGVQRGFGLGFWGASGGPSQWDLRAVFSLASGCLEVQIKFLLSGW